jgi:predicted ribosomally synthesized peptide with SipW-like signal peptide
MKKETRKALAASSVSLTLCAALFAGATFAWFTDSASSGVSTVQSGNLDVNLYQLTTDSEQKTSYSAVTGKTSVFTNKDDWEPGAVEVVYLQVANEGSLALKYKLALPITDEKEGKTADDKTITLSKVLKAAVVPVTENFQYDSREDALKAAESAEKVDLGTDNAITGTLSAKEDAYLAVIVYMPTSVGNEANNNGTDIPSISLGVNLTAGQTPEEEDSYGPDYDTNAPYAVVPVTSQAEIVEKAKTLKEGEILQLSNDISLSAISLPEGTVLDGGGHTVTITNGSSPTIAGDITLQNMTLVADPDTKTWGIVTHSVTFDNVVFDGLSPYIVTATDVSVTNCTIKNTILQFAYQEGNPSISPNKITTVITGNTFIVDNVSSATNHAIVFNTCDSSNTEGNEDYWKNFSKYVVVKDNTFTATDLTKPYYAYKYVWTGGELAKTGDDLTQFYLPDNTYEGNAIAAFNGFKDGDPTISLTAKTE